jgi:hypothetical protein
MQLKNLESTLDQLCNEFEIYSTYYLPCVEGLEAKYKARGYINVNFRQQFYNKKILPIKKILDETLKSLEKIKSNYENRCAEFNSIKTVTDKDSNTFGIESREIELILSKLSSDCDSLSKRIETIGIRLGV